MDLGAALGNDLIKDCVGFEMSYYGRPKPEYTDKWGVRWRYASNASGEYTEIIDHPLAGDMDKLEGYRIPDPAEPSQYENFRQLKQRYGKDKWLIGSCQCSVFEAAWYLRGLQQTMEDLLLEPEYVHRLMDKVMQYPLTAARIYAELGADMIWVGDDLASQLGMMFSVEAWREFLKPRFAKIFAEPKKINPDIKVAYHSCGNCAAVLDEMVEIGLDVLNPLQPMAIDPFAIKKRYGKRLALFGGLCVQRTLPHGPIDAIRSAVRRLKSECGAGGGYILSPAHHIQADTPVEHILAYYEEALKPIR